MHATIFACMGVSTAGAATTVALFALAEPWLVWLSLRPSR